MDCPTRPSSSPHLPSRSCTTGTHAQVAFQTAMGTAVGMKRPGLHVPSDTAAASASSIALKQDSMAKFAHHKVSAQGISCLVERQYVRPSSSPTTGVFCGRAGVCMWHVHALGFGLIWVVCRGEAGAAGEVAAPSCMVLKGGRRMEVSVHTLKTGELRRSLSQVRAFHPPLCAPALSLVCTLACVESVLQTPSHTARS
jgi:hypothetical protein